MIRTVVEEAKNGKRLITHQQNCRRAATNSSSPHQFQSNLLLLLEEVFCSCSKMVKFTSLPLLISFFLILTTIVIYGEAQGETRTKTRSKLSSAVRKRKTNAAKIKLEETTPTPIQLPSVPTESFASGITSDSPTDASIIGEENLAPLNNPTIATPAPTRKVSRERAHSHPPPPPRSGPVPEGCQECDQEKCNTPSDSSCPNGLVIDRCSCCYVCGALEGNRCYNSTLNLPYNPEVGICGPHLDCLLRSDLDPMEPREALCECRDKTIVCGSDRQTYLSECKLREAAHTKPGLRVRSHSPCVSAPMMTTPVENSTVPIGEDVSLSCEVRGYPAPILHWEFLAEGANGMPQILPGDDSNIVIVVRGGPEQIMTTSWIQIIAVNPKRQGIYHCIAKNTEGTAQASAEVRVYKSIGEGSL